MRKNDVCVVTKDSGQGFRIGDIVLVESVKSDYPESAKVYGFCHHKKRTINDYDKPKGKGKWYCDHDVMEVIGTL